MILHIDLTQDSLAVRVQDIKNILTSSEKRQTTQVANFVISNNSKNKRKAMEVLNLLNTSRTLGGLVYGPERQELGSEGKRKPC